MVKDFFLSFFKGSAHVFLGVSEIYHEFPPSIRGKELASRSSDIMAEECAAISPAVLQAAYGQGTSSSLLLNFRSPNTLFPDLPLMRSWIASLVFCGNSSGKLGFLCMALARLWQLLLKIGLLLGKISCSGQPGAGLISIGASDWWRWESCRELYSCERASPVGEHQGAWPDGVQSIFRIYFVKWFMFMKCLWQSHTRELKKEQDRRKEICASQ